MKIVVGRQRKKVLNTGIAICKKQWESGDTGLVGYGQDPQHQHVCTRRMAHIGFSHKCACGSLIGSKLCDNRWEVLELVPPHMGLHECTLPRGNDSHICVCKCGETW